jgi:predicted cation transporter
MFLRNVARLSISQKKVIFTTDKIVFFLILIFTFRDRSRRNNLDVFCLKFSKYKEDV